MAEPSLSQKELGFLQSTTLRHLGCFKLNRYKISIDKIPWSLGLEKIGRKAHCQRPCRFQFLSHSMGSNDSADKKGLESSKNDDFCLRHSDPKKLR
jgi:hypothetical protein